MEFERFEAGKDDDGRRLDRIVRRIMEENGGADGLSGIYGTLRKGLVKVDGKRRGADFRVSAGQTVEVAGFLIKKGGEIGKSPENQKSETETEIGKIEIFRNGHILIVNKPYDIPVQPSRGFQGKALSEIVEEEFRNSPGERSLSFRTGPLHRLDRRTTGLLAFSQSLEGARRFSLLMRERKIGKVYVGIASGAIEGRARWTDGIERRDGGGGKFRTVEASPGAESGRKSVTEAIPLSRGSFCGEEATLALFRIETGRTHQIRAQCALHGHPLLGDSAYGGGKAEGLAREFFLHALEMGIEDPEFGGRFFAPIGEDFRRAAEKIFPGFDVGNLINGEGGLIL